MTAGRADERAETPDPRPMVALARLYEAELLSDRGSLAREVVRLTAELERLREERDEARSLAGELGARPNQVSNATHTRKLVEDNAAVRSALAAAEARLEAVREQVQLASETFKRIEADADALTGDETREQLAHAIGLASGMAMAAHEGLDGWLAALSAGAADTEQQCASCGENGTHDIHFSRTLCSCGAMHYYCGECGRQTDDCLDAADTERTP